ncbi:hypothetical protein Dimus_007827 [Dionaea muscipula]
MPGLIQSTLSDELAIVDLYVNSISVMSRERKRKLAVVVELYYIPRLNHKERRFHFSIVVKGAHSIYLRESKSHPTLRNIHTRMLKENPIEVSQYKAPILSNQEQTDFGQESADDAGYASGLKDGGQPTVDELEEINLGDETDQRRIFIAKSPPGIVRKV